MIKVVVKLPEKDPHVQELDSVDSLEELLEGEFELANEDQLPEISILINEEARGIKAHNFTIQTDGSHDWVYGAAVFAKIEGDSLRSLSDEQIEQIKDYFAKTRAYK